MESWWPPKWSQDDSPEESRWLSNGSPANGWLYVNIDSIWGVTWLPWRVKISWLPRGVMICDSPRESSDSPNGVNIDIESTVCWTPQMESPWLPFGCECDWQFWWTFWITYSYKLAEFNPFKEIVTSFYFLCSCAFIMTCKLLCCFPVKSLNKLCQLL